MKNRKSKERVSLMRDFGLLFLLLWAFVQAMIMAYSDMDNRTAYLILFLFSDLAVMEGFLGHAGLCFALGGTLTCIWVSYKLYSFYAMGTLLTLLDFILIAIPMLGALAAVLFRQGTREVDVENTMLRRQVEELTLVDEITGLYNLRALVRDLNVMVHYCQRNHQPVSLMVIQLRYEQELRSMLPYRKYSDLLQRMGEIIMDCVRREDRCYAIDERGTFGIVLTTTEQDSAVVRGRVLKSLYAEGAMEGILDRGTRPDVRIACKQYFEDKYGNDMMNFKRATESELVYDV